LVDWGSMSDGDGDGGAGGEGDGGSDTGSGVEVEVAAGILRHELVDLLRGSRAVLNTDVEKALRGVPRHAFLPGVPLAQAYADDAVVTRRDAAGMPSSSASQPAIVAIMLEQLELSAGMRVLEIGAGTGYNAALMATLVGPEGTVTTVDIDPETAAAARANLDEAGFRAVRVECGDGGLGYPADAPYDRIIVTVGAWDLPPAWFEQLGAHGLLVVPLGLRGPQRSICFAHEGDARPDAGPHASGGGTWRSRSIVDCGFMAMRGSFAGPGRQIGLGDDNSLWVDDGRPVDLDAVRRSLAGPTTEGETGLLVSKHEAWTSLSLWLALTDDEYVRLHMPDSLGAGALLREDSLAVLVRRPAAVSGSVVDSEAAAEQGGEGSSDRAEQFEIVVRAFGPGGAILARRLTDGIVAWHRAGRPSTERLQVEVHPMGTPDRLIAADYIIDKIHTRLGISFGDTG
jgi:protein-L-isoaspartate(D-aspartate) O-methyltransferase